MRWWQSGFSVFVVSAGIGLAHAQSTAGAGSVIVVPVVAQTASYSSEVIVRNPNAAPIGVRVKFYEAINSSSPGFRDCGTLAIAAFVSQPFLLSAQCGITDGGGHFGPLVLEDAAAQKTNLFFAYSRTQTPGGNGFSVEGFPIGAFSGADADVVGLKRSSTPPFYSSNCFVAALGEPVDYQMVLRDGTTNAVIGAKTASLQPFEQYRMLDVFKEVGEPTGDYANVRANFTVPGATKPALMSFCTVQESTFFGADFRIAKSVDALSDAQRRVACIGQDSCGTVSTTQPETITNATVKNVYSLIITPPDYIGCDIVGPRAGELQIRLRQWGDPFTSTPYSGADEGNKSSFYVFVGDRSELNNGTATRWFIDVSARDAGATVPIDFGVTCRSGNGIEVPWFRGNAAKDF